METTFHFVNSNYKLHFRKAVKCKDRTCRIKLLTQAKVMYFSLPVYDYLITIICNFIVVLSKSVIIPNVDSTILNFGGLWEFFLKSQLILFIYFMQVH